MLSFMESIYSEDAPDSFETESVTVKKPINPKEQEYLFIIKTILSLCVGINRDTCFSFFGASFRKLLFCI
jgi:hypothetical protein